MKTARLVLVSLVAALLATLAAPAHASVTGSTATLQCGGGQVKAMAPAVYTDRSETVFWSTQLYRYTANGWATVGSYTPMAYSGSVYGRTHGWYYASNNAGILFRNYSGLGSGYYAVVNYFWTQSGGWTTSISSYGNTYYCAA